MDSTNNRPGALRQSGPEKKGLYAWAKAHGKLMAFVFVLAVVAVIITVALVVPTISSPAPQPAPAPPRPVTDASDIRPDISVYTAQPV